MVLFEMTVIYRLWVKQFVKMLRADQIQFPCQVSDLNYEIRNGRNFKEIDLQKKEGGRWLLQRMLELIPSKNWQ
jgi:hypothetical protein